MPRALPLDPDSRRAQLLEVSRQVFGRRGYHATSVADIIAEAGVARGTFYNYFESKRAVFQAVLDDLMDRINASVTPIDTSGDIPGQMRDNLRHVVEALGEASDMNRLLFADAVGLDAEGDDALRAFYGQAVARIARALQAGQTMGIVRDGDVQIMARCLLGLVKEPLFQSWLQHEPLHTAGLVDELAAIVMGGVWSAS